MRYRASKLIREIRKNFKLSDIAKRLGYSRQYVANVQEMIIKPNEDFISRLKKLFCEIKGDTR